MFKINRIIISLFMMFSLSACLGTIVDAAVDTTIAVAKVPFKVAGAAVDVATGDGKKDKDEQKQNDEEDK